MEAESYVNKYEQLQVLAAVLLGLVHFPIYFVLLGMTLLSGGVYAPLPLAFGVLEIAASWKMSGSMTLRSAEAPTSVRSALGGLKPWLLGIGILTVLLTFVCLGYAVTGPW